MVGRWWGGGGEVLSCMGGRLITQTQRIEFKADTGGLLVGCMLVGCEWATGGLLAELSTKYIFRI